MLERVFRALGDPGGRVLHIRDVDGVEQDYQSVPPFITVFDLHESWTYLGPLPNLSTPTQSPRDPRARIAAWRSIEAMAHSRYRHRASSARPAFPGLPGG
jgi:hypothetical protein